ncbi:MAG: hypothetical protein COB39_04165 [Marinosulfonomonas sp.]|nr:MAG: hypothetical protein COB39_04165 [Marinosulfonomonas sp.]
MIDQEKLTTTQRGKIAELHVATALTSLFPGDYVSESQGIDKFDAFDLCAKDVDAALQAARQELEADGFKGFELGRATFEQCDSGNIYHAGAHFSIEVVSGISQPQIDAIFA